ncbi:MAG: hypothetical protein ACRCXL_12895 [Dermatophilaceae bacterium]
MVLLKVECSADGHGTVIEALEVRACEVEAQVGAGRLSGEPLVAGRHDDPPALALGEELAAQAALTPREDEDVARGRLGTNLRGPTV